MRAVDVRIGHDDDAVIAQVIHVEFLAQLGAEREGEVVDLLIVHHLVERGAFDIQDFSAQRQDGLGFPVACLLRRAASGIPLDEEEFRAFWSFVRAVGQLAWQAEFLGRGLA